MRVDKESTNINRDLAENLCECPVVDGGVPTSEVDKEKFEEWCVDVLDADLANKTNNLNGSICNFCIWDMEVNLKSRVSKEDSEKFDVWLNTSNVKPTFETALKSYYIVGKVKRCWVKLEKVTVPEKSDGEDEEEAGSPKQEDTIVKMMRCFYCGEKKQSLYLNEHVKLMHSNVAIRCEIKWCRTYFHTQDEYKKHFKQMHDVPKNLNFKCIYCGKRLATYNSYKYHVKIYHSDQEIKCMHCFSYFKTRTELNSHFELVHKKVEMARKFKCDNCEYKAPGKVRLKLHILRKHVHKLISCDKCGENFSSTILLQVHNRAHHLYKVCNFCHLDVTVKQFYDHCKARLCRRCRIECPCSGLLQSHFKECKKTMFTCEKCQTSFKTPCLLKYHKKRCQSITWINQKYKNSGFKCDPCMTYYRNALSLKWHLDYKHNTDAMISCAHCPQTFSKFSLLIKHLSIKHDLLEKKHKCCECEKSYFYLYLLNRHKERAHSEAKYHKYKCALCGKLVKTIRTHMLNIHGVRM